MRRVLYTASTFSHIHHFHMPYLKAFKDNGWQVDAACGGPLNEKDRTELMVYVDRTVNVPFRKHIYSTQNLSAVHMLKRLVSENSYELIIANTSLAAFFTRMALSVKKRPRLVNIVHGYLFDDESPALKKSLLLKAEQITAHRTDLIMTMNRYDSEAAGKYHLADKTVQIPGMGVDYSFIERTPYDAGKELRELYKIPDNRFILLYAAEFSARKSQHILIHAMKLLPGNTALVLAGEGKLRKACERAAEPFGDRVLFTGFVNDMGPLYRMADAAVSSSRSEGLPFNIMEAMRSGLPVVASEVKGHTDLITHGSNGLLYPYGNESAFAACIRSLMESAALRKHLGSNAAKNALDYSIENVFPRVWNELELFQ